VRLFSDETATILRVWANRIEVEQAGDELVIFGTNPGKATPHDLLQLFNHYLFAPDREREAKGPHLEFASAKSEAELIQFIKKWGPITAAYVGEHDWSKKHPEINRGVQASASSGEVRTTESKKAVESLRRVRKVQAVIAAAASLIKISHEKNRAPETILGAMSQLVSSLQEEWREFHATSGPNEISPGCELGSSGLLVDCEMIHGDAKRKRASRKDPDLTELCRDLLCALVNRFPDHLISTKQGVLPVPAAGHGVLPLLMFMLRQDLISGRRIIICEKCGDYLLQRRHGERACPSCKDALRAKRYYERKRKKILRRRKEKRRLRTKTKGGLEPSK
jgi:hypothetical protein